MCDFFFFFVILTQLCVSSPPNRKEITTAPSNRSSERQREPVHLLGTVQRRIGFNLLVFLVGIVHDGLNVVSWKKSRDAVADTFEPAVIILLDDVDDSSFHEGQLVLLVLGVVVDGHNWRKHQREL